MLLKGHAKNRLIVLIILLVLLVISYVCLVIYNNQSLKEYNKKVLPNSYIEEFDISEYSYDNVVKKIEYSKEYIENKKIKVNIDNKEFEYTLKDLGIEVDINSTIEKIKEMCKASPPTD